MFPKCQTVINNQYIPGFVTLPVRDVRPFLHQSGDHSAQSQQRLVDVSRLASSLVHRTRAPDVLTAGEIHLEGEEGVNAALR